MMYVLLALHHLVKDWNLNIIGLKRILILLGYRMQPKHTPGIDMTVTVQELAVFMTRAIIILTRL